MGVRLTARILQEWKDLGFRFVLVKGYTVDRYAGCIELNHFMVEPVKQLPEDPADQEIYEPIDSEILLGWASSTESGVLAFIQKDS